MEARSELIPKKRGRSSSISSSVKSGIVKLMPREVSRLILVEWKTDLS